MASDLGSWNSEDFTILARLLRITAAQIIRHQVSLQERARYFGEILHRGDLFLDPDTGVATRRVNDHRRYVNPPEIAVLLDASPDRLLAVYQHVRAQRVADRIDTVLTTLRDQIGDVSWCTYESATVAMVFLTRAPARTTQVAEHLASLLGRHAVGRIRP